MKLKVTESNLMMTTKLFSLPMKLKNKPFMYSTLNYDKLFRLLAH